MIRIITALAFAALATAAEAQQTTIRDARGNVVGRSATDSQGTVTTYDSTGRVVTRESTSGNQTTIYDDKGRTVGRYTMPQR